MSTESIGGITSIRLANFYKFNQSNINDNMMRIASGKRFSSPGIYAADYFHAAAMKNDVRGLQVVDREMVFAVGMVKAAEQAGQLIFEGVTRMAELVKKYYNNTSDSFEQVACTTEFDSIKKRISYFITDTLYDGKQVVTDNGGKPLRQVVLDPRDISQTLDISFNAGDIVDVSTLTIGDPASNAATEMDNIDAEVFKAGSYLAKTTGYLFGLNSFHNMNEKKVVTCAKDAEDTENTDTGKEYMLLSKRQIAQQMTVSMMSQANMVRSSVLSLIGVK